MMTNEASGLDYLGRFLVGAMFVIALVQAIGQVTR